MKMKWIAAVFFLAVEISFGQNQGYMNIGNRYGNFYPDSLQSISITGKLTADSLMMNGMYYLDVNNNNEPDYVLIFGPYWYSPVSSNASRPNTGDTITITGGLFDGMADDMPMVVVYTINGNFWRSPYDSYWNEMGMNSMMGGEQHMGMGYAFGWDHDSLQSINIKGILLVDSTLIYNNYYLDTNSDGTPDCFLNFGPPWYTPSSDFNFPTSGDSITISGLEMETGIMNMIIVYKINGQMWRDSGFVGSNLGCGWIQAGMNQSQQFYNPFDSTDWMQVNPGWGQGGMMGGAMGQDSLYCQILEVFPQNVPDDSAENVMAAFETGIFYPDGMNGMHQSGRMGGYMNFNSNVNFQFHFNAAQSKGYNINGNGVSVKYWNESKNQWIAVNNAVFNSHNSTVTISQNQVSNFYIVAADKITNTVINKTTSPDAFELLQNYPNPFNPSTMIEFSLKESSKVNLTVFNILGQKVKTLINETLSPGFHHVKFDASDLPSGIYFYRISIGHDSKVMKMELLK